MRLSKFKISKFRSIENIEIIFPLDAPLVLFGPNNVGKSNILRAMDIMLGERHASYYDFQDSDYFMRDKANYPNICFMACFDEDYYSGNDYNPSANEICFTTNFRGTKESIFHYTPSQNYGKKIFLSNPDREKCQLIFVDANRDINRQLSYFSQYSVLSRMAKRMHEVMKNSVKEKLDDEFHKIKEIFESVPEYGSFHEKLQRAFETHIDGFEHKLEIDLSSCDPNNYFSSLRIVAKDGNQVRSFEEFGTGEQQILLLSFIKAYAETFKGETFLLGIEEPEAHLHPIAQRWLAKNIAAISKSGVQVVITTHSPEFLEIEHLEGFVKVYKEGNKTKIIQHSKITLVEESKKLKADTRDVTEDTVINFYKTKTFYDQLRGFFARRIILVEGESESFSLPNYFRNHGFDLEKKGIEIVNCRGKNQISRNYRLFKAYQYDCFCLFDADTKKEGNEDLANTLKFDQNQMNFNEENFSHEDGSDFGYFGKDYETYLRKNLIGYESKEDAVQGKKVIKAKIISEQNKDFKPDFVKKIASFFKIEASQSLLKTATPPSTSSLK